MPNRRMSDTNGINKAISPTSSIVQRRIARKMSPWNRNPALANKIAEMRLTIAPIVHVETGIPAPEFPSTMLDLFLLTEAQLDALAAYYSQTHSTDLTNQYPQTMNWQQPFLDASDTLPENCKLGELERLKIKMRMFARFIGMRGADTPRWEYDRQIEILRNKIQRRITDEEEKVLRKFYQGPVSRP
ncbi:hypothetical protein J4E85_008625 [Alternaria conjuncta]|uniref:uncharacterized protein n=1 Tax=Alternaria hordeiaustralica TaxID=1187925 RepID=UPI0020C2CD38|nr:uncharacterized protein J4E84_010707 [Alternaria hordeiaustralica]XP_051323069.1 uncharacterized protein J4E85_008625 [Alternaria conjuncta]KAI4674201.1 hypothetical protein J4E84_010707 [Alternaria hordeiaustralica]KAI4921280.1 hypothetical protein J4E85_008625 [Alternaria conjuncta]